MTEFQQFKRLMFALARPEKAKADGRFAEAVAFWEGFRGVAEFFGMHSKGAKKGRRLVRIWDVIKVLSSPLYALKRTYPVLFYLAMVYMIIPMSTAANERGFSHLKLIKSRLRSTLNGESPNNLITVKFSLASRCLPMLAASIPGTTQFA